MIFAIERRCEQAHDMHPRLAGIMHQIFGVGVFENLRGHQFAQFIDHMAKAMNLPLPPDMRGRAAGILNILLPVHHLPDGFGFCAVRVPEMDREDQ